MIHNAHPNELRRKLLKLMEADKNKQELARQFNVSISLLYRIVRQKRETGSADLNPDSLTGPPCGVDAGLKKETLLLLERRPEMCASDVQRYWQSKGVRLCLSRVHQILGNLGWNAAWKNKQMLKVYGTSSLHKAWLLTGQPGRLRKPPARPGGKPARRPIAKNPAFVERGKKGSA